MKLLFFQDLTMFESCPIPFIALDEELLRVHGIDEPEETPAGRQVTAKTMPDPASPRGTTAPLGSPARTAPLGSPARVRAPDGDGTMMTMLEASCLEKHHGDPW